MDTTRRSISRVGILFSLLDVDVDVSIVVYIDTDDSITDTAFGIDSAGSGVTAAFDVAAVA